MTPRPAAVLVIACNRPSYLRRTLASVLRHNHRALPVIVSQDGADAGVAAVVRDYQDRRPAIHLRHVPGAVDRPPAGVGLRVPIDRADYRRWKGHYRIARHYRWAFAQVFDRLGLDSVIVLEDDLELAPDFFDYIGACVPLLDRDPTIRTVSAWNDNSCPALVADPARLHRTECFPGLGWLMTRGLWRDLAPIWPRVFWDDWLRALFRHKGWVAIRPEVARTATFGEIGVSRGECYHEYLKTMKLNDQRVDFDALDLGYLVKERYDRWLYGAIRSAPIVTPEQIAAANGPADLRVLYHGERSFASIARLFGLMPDFREGMPRTSYHGVVTFRHRGGGSIFLVPLRYLLSTASLGAVRAGGRPGIASRPAPYAAAPATAPPAGVGR
jgi:alpha-1,3-mannosyl-glycoprotein beta-1,2-N-acetylglucosaminyltransferase